MALVKNLLNYLQQMQDRGETHVFLDADARQVLNELQRGENRPQLVHSTNESSESPVSVATKVVESSVTEWGTAPKPIEVPKKVEIPTGDARAQLNALALKCKEWPPSGHLASLRKKLVFAGGNPEARLMLIGDSPAFQEERAKKPFVGPAGQKLEQILKAMGLGFDEVYLTNLVKFRPILPKQTTNDRKPTSEEIRIFLPILEAELDVVKPEIVIALGETVSQALLGFEEGLLEKARGHQHEWSGIPLVVTFHPSYLLHQDSPLGEKRKLWEDMLTVMEFLKLPISDKQRGFFKN